MTVSARTLSNVPSLTLSVSTKMGIQTAVFLSFLLLSSAIAQLVDKVNIPANVLDLALQVNKVSDPSDNVIFSPLSISAALHLLLLGADGVSEQQLKKFLGYRPEVAVSAVNQAYNTILTTLKARSSSIEAKVSSSVITRKGLAFNKNYVDGTKNYDAETITLDFVSEAQKSLKIINGWVANKTNNKITEILAEPLPPYTKLVILNAVYFKGGWRESFPKDLVQKGDFFLTPERKVQVDFMVNSVIVPYVDSSYLDCKAIELPYSDLDYSMLLLVPKSNSSQAVLQLEEKLTAEVIHSLVSNFTELEVAVRIPKFRIRKSIPVLSVLQNAGVTSVFGPNAELTKFVQEPVQVDAIVHEAYVEVTEEGTEATGVTAIFPIRSLSKNFVANKPFIFIIRHKKLNLSLFHGRVITPEF